MNNLNDSSIPSLLQAWNIKFEDLEFSKEIGSGGFGKVYRGEYLGAPVAIKKVHIAPDDPNRRDLEKFLHREIETIKLFSHPNVIQFVGIASHDQILYIVTELVEGGDLQYYLKNKSIELPWLLRINIAHDVSLAMSYLHSKNIVHRDLKSTNLLVDVKWKIKVCDFGFARIVDDDNNKSMTICGTDNWMAPEMIKGQDYDEKCDVFSFGILLFELVTRMKPTPNMRDANFGINMDVISQYIPEDCPNQFLKLTFDCCTINSVERPSFKDIAQVLKAMKVQLYGPNPQIEYPALRSFHNVAPIPQIKAIGQQSPPTYGLIADAKKLMSNKHLPIENNFDEEEDEEEEQEQEQPENSNVEESNTIDTSNSKVDNSDYLSFPRPYSDPEVSTSQLGSNNNEQSEYVDFSFPRPSFSKDNNEEPEKQPVVVEEKEEEQVEVEEVELPTPQNNIIDSNNNSNNNDNQHDDDDDDDDDEYDQVEEYQQHPNENNIVYSDQQQQPQHNEDDDYDNENEMDYDDEDEDESSGNVSPIHQTTPMKKNVSFDLSRVSYHTYEKAPKFEDDSDYEEEEYDEYEEDGYDDFEDDEDEDYDEEEEQILQQQYQLQQQQLQRQQQLLQQLQDSQEDADEEYDDVIRHDSEDEEEDEEDDVIHHDIEDDDKVDNNVEKVQVSNDSDEEKGEPVDSVKPIEIVEVISNQQVVEEPVVVQVVEEPKTEEPVVQVVEEPKQQEEQVIEEPKTEEPVVQVVEELKPEEPVVVQVVEEPVVVQVVEEPVVVQIVEEPVVVQIVEEPKQEEPKVVEEPVVVQIVEEPKVNQEPISIQVIPQLDEPKKVQEPVIVEPVVNNNSIIASSSPIIESTQIEVVQSPQKTSPQPQHQTVEIQSTPVKTTTTTSTNVESSTRPKVQTQNQLPPKTNEKDPLISTKVQRNCCNCWVM